MAKLQRRSRSSIEYWNCDGCSVFTGPMLCLELMLRLFNKEEENIQVFDCRIGAFIEEELNAQCNFLF